MQLKGISDQCSDLAPLIRIKTKYDKSVTSTCGTSAGVFKFNFGSLNGYDVAGVCDKVKELLAKQNFDRLQSIFVGSTKNHIYGIQKHEIVEPIAGVAASAVYAKTQDWLNEKISKIASQYRAEHDHSGPITLNHDDKNNVFRNSKTEEELASQKPTRARTYILQEQIDAGTLRKEDITPDVKIKAEVFNKNVDKLIKQGYEEGSARQTVAKAIAENEHFARKEVKVAVVGIVAGGLGGATLSAAILDGLVGKAIIIALATGMIYTAKDIKEKVDAQSKSDKMASSGSPDPNDDKNWKKNPTKSESKIWKELKHFKGKTKTNGLSGSKKRFYQWDHTHNDIEVYDSNRNHLGTMDPSTGKMIKPPKIGRDINL